MPFILQCPREDCRKFMLVEDSDRGKAIECLVCRRMFQATITTPPSSQTARSSPAAPAGRSQPGPNAVRPSQQGVTWPSDSESSGARSSGPASGGSRATPTRPAVPQPGAFTPPAFTPPPVAPSTTPVPPGLAKGGPTPSGGKVVRVCPQCQTPLSVPDMPGKKIRCPRCSTIF